MNSSVWELSFWSPLASDNNSLGTNTQLNQPLYSPYLALRAFWLSPKIKWALQGPRVAAIATVQKHIPKAEKAVPKEKWKPEKAFQKCPEQWLHDWNKCHSKVAGVKDRLPEGCLLKIRVITL